MKPQGRDPSREWVQRASRGDAIAIDALLERHLPGLEAYVRKHASEALLERESASDVVQSVCRELLEGLGRFEYQGEAAFRGWLYRAALHKIVDRHRRHTAEKRGAERVQGEVDASTLSAGEFAALGASLRSPSGEAILNEEIGRLERCFASLPESDRKLIRLVFVDGLTHAQVAERLGLSEVNSRKILSRALAKLSRQIV
jgi:RNA polymerase sigma factor (sigma-70 family)